MAEIRSGKLVVRAVKKGQQVVMDVPTKKGSHTLPVEHVLAPDLRALSPATLHDMEVDYELENGRPVRVRPKGATWQVPVPDPGSDGATPTAPPNARAMDFHNPYNFVPALPRETVEGDLGDHRPAGHDRYHAGCFSGVIRVRMTLETPLLLPDAAAATENQDRHKTFPVRVDANGDPYLPPTSIKGMLRSAYEAVTNSRLAVFEGHEDRLAYRMPARDGLSLVPARIENNRIDLLMGTTSALPTWDPGNRRWRVPGDLVYAAWLPRYNRNTGRIAAWAARYPGGQLPEHGERVRVWIELVRRGPFRYWKVRKIVPFGQPIGAQPSPSKPWGQHQPVASVPMRDVDGYVCITNENIKNKHDERVFFTAGSPVPSQPLTPELSRAWTELVDNYQAIHETDLEKRRAAGDSPAAYLGGEPGKTAWSRHVHERSARELGDGTLCYAFVRATGANPYEVVALYPVMISRKPYDVSPGELLPTALHPALSLDDLSPADRVFGWVKQGGKGAYRGNLRIGPVTCETPDAVERFAEQALPLAILGQPKPQQGGFYVARSARGNAQAKGQGKAAAGYVKGKGLRGRKVYPHHHGLPEGYWDNPLQDRTQQALNGYFQEYRRPHEGVKETVTVDGRPKERVRMGEDGTYRLNLAAERCDDQNRSTLGWVKKGAVFSFEIQVTNLCPTELGALIWLLSLDRGHFHRLGGGKPLGFGSARLEIDRMDFRDGQGWADWYATLSGPEASAGKHLQKLEDAADAIAAFKDAVKAVYGNGKSFESVPFIAAFLRAARGFEGVPTHYPRTRESGQTGLVPPHPDGLAYRWFVANDREPQGPHFALPDLDDDPGFPLLDAD